MIRKNYEKLEKAFDFFQRKHYNEIIFETTCMICYK